MGAPDLVIAGFLSVTPAVVASSPVEQTLVDLEKQSWAAWQTKDVAFWRRHLSADHVEMDGPSGPQDRDYVINGVAGRKCDVTSYSLDNFTFRQLGPDAAMLIYHASQEFACGDRRIPNSGWVTSLYRRSGGRWQNVLFEHLVTPTASAAPRP
jgi:hypothetical protein